MKFKIYLSLAALFCASACADAADDDAGRAKLIGSWQVSSNAQGAAWTFSYTIDSVKVTQIEGGNTIADFACGVDGKECQVKIAGKKATVSFWFNGPRLVEVETRGSNVVKRRFGVGTPDDVMELEIMPMSSSAKNETLKFKRLATESAKK
jgi:hypothetical protein